MTDEYFEPFIKLGEAVQKELEDLGLVVVQFVPLPNFRQGAHHVQVVLEVDPERVKRVLAGEESVAPDQKLIDQQFEDIIRGDKASRLSEEETQTADDLKSLRDSLAEEDIKKNLDEGDGIL